MDKFYLIAAIFGAALTWCAALVGYMSWTPEAGAVSADPLFSALLLAFAVNLALTGFVFLVWSAEDARRRRVGGWPGVLITMLLAGPAAAMPLYLRSRWRKARGLV